MVSPCRYLMGFYNGVVKLRCLYLRDPVANMLQLKIFIAGGKYLSLTLSQTT